MGRLLGRLRRDHQLIRALQFRRPPNLGQLHSGRVANQARHDIGRKVLPPSALLGDSTTELSDRFDLRQQLWIGRFATMP
jgi:hypothetical protein